MAPTAEGFSAEEYLEKLLDAPAEVLREFTRLSPDTKTRYDRLLGELKRVNSNKACTTKEKGEALEKIVAFLLGVGKILKVKQNIHNTTNEIDQLITLDNRGKILKKVGVINIRGESFLGECKNYNKTIGVTWVGKVFSLIATTGSRLAVLFSYHGLSGSGWGGATGLTKKLYLTKEDIDKRIHIVSFSLPDFEEISKGQSFFEILDNKVEALQVGADFSSYIKTHPAEDKLKATKKEA